MKRFLLLAVNLSIGYLACAQEPTDTEATKKTRHLLENLHEIAEKGMMFGHQDDLAYGIGWKNEKGRSDVKETAGSYPAVYGWDVGKKLNNPNNIDDIPFENMVGWIREAYKRRGINTFSWHLDNLTTGGDSWDKTPSVPDLLPGGAKHAEFMEQLDLLADLLNECQVWFTKVPIIFRPWHEHNGDWFWWGKGNTSEEDYISLFRFTVDYLKNEKKIHHLLYSFSPDRSRLRMDSLSKENYLYGYPGDEYVDIIGIDNYGDVGRVGGNDPAHIQKENFLNSLKLITQIAKEKGKVAALTETGLERVTDENWFTDIILNPIKENQDEIEIAWVLVWRNANPEHHYAPYAGHPSVENFRKFRTDRFTFFEDDLKNPYKKGQAFKINP